MSDSSTPTPAPAAETPKNGTRPLAIAAGLGVALMLALGGYAMYNYDGKASAETVPPTTTVTEVAEGGETLPTPVAATVLVGPVTVAAHADTRLAPVTIRRQDHLCAVLVFDQAVIEGVGGDDLKWGTKSSKERFELCGKDLKKESDGSLTVGGRRVKLSELIAADGGEEYTSLTSTPGALARCWGDGQINADGQPACTDKPAEVIAQNATK